MLYQSAETSSQFVMKKEFAWSLRFQSNSLIEEYLEEVKCIFSLVFRDGKYCYAFLTMSIPFSYFIFVVVVVLALCISLTSFQLFSLLVSKFFLYFDLLHDPSSLTTYPQTNTKAVKQYTGLSGPSYTVSSSSGTQRYSLPSAAVLQVSESLLVICNYNDLNLTN